VGHRIQHLFIKSIFQKSLKKNFGKMILFVKTRSNKTKCHWATFSRVASASQILRGFNTNLVLELPYKFLYTEECFSIRFFESTVFILAGFENAIVSRKHYIIHFLKYFNDVAKKAKGLLLACIFKLAWFFFRHNRKQSDVPEHRFLQINAAAAFARQHFVIISFQSWKTHQ